MKKILCIFLNLVLHGVGTLVLKRNLNGSLQLAMALFGLLLVPNRLARLFRPCTLWLCLPLGSDWNRLD